jgi:hypothetical protein
MVLNHVGLFNIYEAHDINITYAIAVCLVTDLLLDLPAGMPLQNPSGNSLIREFSDHCLLFRGQDAFYLMGTIAFNVMIPVLMVRMVSVTGAVFGVGGIGTKDHLPAVRKQVYRLSGLPVISSVICPEETLTDRMQGRPKDTILLYGGGELADFLKPPLSTAHFKGLQRRSRSCVLDTAFDEVFYVYEKFRFT